jgi:hypothetical protein
VNFHIVGRIGDQRGAPFWSIWIWSRGIGMIIWDNSWRRVFFVSVRSLCFGDPGPHRNSQTVSLVAHELTVVMCMSSVTH